VPVVSTTPTAPATSTTPATPAATRDEIARRLDEHRPAIAAHCRRVLGSDFDADDAVQETMVRAWRSYDRFEGRSSLVSWLRRIAGNVCFDLLDARRRQGRPTDHTAEDGPIVIELAAGGGAAAAGAGDPADRTVEREEVRLAFAAALLHLPPRQRSVLLLRDVLRWRASEVAELLDTSVASVNSALQRGRATLADLPSVDEETVPPIAGRLADALERCDAGSLLALLG
jgi:RNA polymerase sigma-70 factor (ECF subfamily)